MTRLKSKRQRLLELLAKIPTSVKVLSTIVTVSECLYLMRVQISIRLTVKRRFDRVKVMQLVGIFFHRAFTQEGISRSAVDSAGD